MRRWAVGAMVVAAFFPSTAIGGTARISGGAQLLFVAADGETNQLAFSQVGETATIQDGGATITAGSGCVTVTANEVQCSSSFGFEDVFLRLGDMSDEAAILQNDGPPVQVLGGSGDDQLDACTTCEVDLSGEAGRDTLTAAVGFQLEGGRGGDTITGGAGQNTILGGTGHDSIAAGGGPDYILPGLGDDTVDGGPGRDLIEFHVRAPVSVNLRTGMASGQGEDQLVSIRDVLGSSRADRIVGDALGNELVGSGGADELLGRGGDDSLYGGFGRAADRLFGGKGDDRLLTGGGDDLLVGARGLDRLRGGGGDDRIRARDRLRDFVDGGSGFDRARIDPRLDDVESVEVVG